MSAYCHAEHPDHPGARCRLDPGNHERHLSTKGSWPNTEFVGMTAAEVATRKPATGGRKKRQEQTARSLGDLIAIRAKAAAAAAGGPSTLTDEMAEKWDATPWVDAAKRVTLRWLSEHPEPFTTAEHWWPLLNQPEEMRAMVRVVQAHLRAGRMVEVGTKRLTDTYRTRDGHEFAMNKKVPVYQSRICPR